MNATMFSSPNARVNQDNRTGEYFTADRNGNRRPTDMQALPSRPRTINPARQHSATSQLHSTAGLHRPITQQIKQSGVSLTGHARTVNRHDPTGNLPDLSSSHDSSAQSDSTLSNSISQSPGDQWTRSTPRSIRLVQEASSPNHLPAVPTSSIRSTDAVPPLYAHPAGASQSSECQMCSDECWQRLTLP